MLTGTNLTYARAHNVRIVLETIRLFGPLSRVDIARRTELTAQTVSNITRTLFRAGMILEGDRHQEGRGAPSTLLKLNPNGAFAIGLELDQDHLAAVLLDLAGAVRQQVVFDLPLPTPAEAMDRMEEAVHTLITREGVAADRLRGVGISVPGPLEVSEGSLVEGSSVTSIVNPNSFPGWKRVPLQETMRVRLATEVHLENNATAAAIGERWYGAGRHVSTFFYLFFGLGLGGGLVINGQPYRGHTGNAGEVGYMPMPRLARPMADTPSHLGVFFNLPRLYENLTRAGAAVSHPRDLEPLFQQGHPVMMEWLEVGAEVLTPLLLSIEYLLDPRVIFLGGRVPPAVLDDLRRRVAERLPAQHLSEKSSMPELRLATSGPEAAALGVATLPLFYSFAPVPEILSKRVGSRRQGSPPRQNTSTPLDR